VALESKVGGNRTHGPPQAVEGRSAFGLIAGCQGAAGTGYSATGQVRSTGQAEQVRGSDHSFLN
jgi:hypothetical protein